MARTNGRLTPEEFVLRALVKLRKPPYPGIHTVYSGFNEAFRAYFPKLDPIKEVEKLVEAGVITCRPSRGGAFIKKANKRSQTGKKEPGKTPSTASALQKMGL